MRDSREIRTMPAVQDLRSVHAPKVLPKPQIKRINVPPPVKLGVGPNVKPKSLISE